MEQHDNAFQFTYSAAQRSEVEQIRSKYMPREIDKLEQLRQLDRAVTHKAQTRAIILGVIGTLILGSGMSLIMTDLWAILGLTVELAMVIGIPVGLVGLVLVALAYPVYDRVLKKERQRVAPEILRLTEELM